MTKRVYRLLNMLYGALCGIITGGVMLVFFMTTKLIPAMLYMQLLRRVNLYAVLGKHFGISSIVVIYLFHFSTALILGVVFAILFHQFIKGICWGMGIGLLFGVLWWLLTPFYILPLFFLISTDETWQLFSVFTLLNSLTGHIIFGIILGTVYAGFKKLLLFQAK